MARPKTDVDKKLSKRFIFPLTEDEFKRISKAAETCGLPAATIVRKKVFTGKFPQAKLPKLDLQTYTELKKSGVNLNQLTRQVNSGIVSPGFLSLLAKLLQQQETIIILLTMIASQKAGKSFMGALGYNLKKLDHKDPDKRAELLETNFSSLDTSFIKREVD